MNDDNIQINIEVGNMNITAEDNWASDIIREGIPYEKRLKADMAHELKAVKTSIAEELESADEEELEQE